MWLKSYRELRGKVAELTLDLEREKAARLQDKIEILKKISEIELGVAVPVRPKRDAGMVPVARTATQFREFAESDVDQKGARLNAA